MGRKRVLEIKKRLEKKYMKKLTIFLLIMWFIAFGIANYQDAKREEERYREMVLRTTNPRLSIYEGVKVRGSNVKALMSNVETLNAQKVFPIDIRYGDVLPKSYLWHTQETKLINPEERDFIKDSAYFEVVIQDQLPEKKLDGYLDTITIRPYNEYYFRIQSVSGE